MNPFHELSQIEFEDQKQSKPEKPSFFARLCGGCSSSEHESEYATQSSEQRVSTFFQEHYDWEANSPDSGLEACRLASHKACYFSNGAQIIIRIPLCPACPATYCIQDSQGNMLFKFNIEPLLEICIDYPRCIYGDFSCFPSNTPLPRAEHEA